MRVSSSLVASAAMLLTGASAEKYLGFNSGATLADRSAKFKKDFEAEFRTAQNLDKSPGKFNAVRLYTNVQAYSKDDPIQAFEAAIDTQTKMLLGIWTSGTDSIANELNALKKAVDKHGKKFTDLVVGMSVGSEDLYRVSETGIKNKSGVGNGPKEIVKFIDDYKKAFANTPLASVPVGHVDTWDVWINGSNKAVIDAVDWIGVDEYPYYENGKGNNIENAGVLFDKAFDAVVAASAGKEVWLTETGWPYIGPAWDKAVASKENAKYYWNEVGCRKLFGKVHTFWYNLRDSNPDNEMKFAITEDLSTKPLFDLSCPTTFKTPTTTGDTATPSGTGVAPSTSSGAGSGGSGSPSGSGGTPGSNDQGAGGAAGATKPPGSGAAGLAISGLAIAAGVFAALL